MTQQLLLNYAKASGALSEIWMEDESVGKCYDFSTSGQARQQVKPIIES